MKSSKKQLTKDEVIHITQLVKLPLSEEEVGRFQKELTETLEKVDELQKIKTTNISPTSHVTGAENVTRKDKIDISQRLSQTDALKNAHKVYNTMYEIEAILESDK